MPHSTNRTHSLREDAPDIRPQLGSGVEGGGAAAVAKAVAEDAAKREAILAGHEDVMDDLFVVGSGGLDALVADDALGGLSRISGDEFNNDGMLLAGGPPPQVGPFRTPSFTSGRGMSSRGGTAGGRGHPASPGYPPYDPTQHHAQVSHQGWYAHPPQPIGNGGNGGGVYPTQHVGDGTDRNPSDMTFAGKTFHPTDSAQTADVSDISGLSLNVGVDLPSPSNAAGGGGGSGSGRSGGGGGEMRFSHRSAWQHNQLRNRAARYAQAAAATAHRHPGAPQDQHEEGRQQRPHHPSRYAQHLQSQQYQHHHHHHHGGQYQLPQPSPIKGSDKSKMSDLSLSMSFGLSGSDPAGKLARSLSIPGLKSGDLMSLGEASFHALLEDEALANFDAELRRANPQLGYAGGAAEASAGAAGAAAAGVPAAVSEDFAHADAENDGKPPARDSASSKSSSAAKSSGQHSAAEASQRSNISMAEVSMTSVRSSASSWMRNYRGQDPAGAHEIDGTDMVNPWLAMEGRPDSGGDRGSQLSILSEISTELMALDLADGAPTGARW